MFTPEKMHCDHINLLVGAVCCYFSKTARCLASVPYFTINFVKSRSTFVVNIIRICKYNLVNAEGL